MSSRAGNMLIIILLITPSLHSEETEKEDTPSIDFLEFLGEWETTAGDWIAPEELEGEAYRSLPDPQVEEHGDE